MEGFEVWKVRGLVTMAMLLLSLSAFPFAPIPKESAKALRVMRGKSFSSGAVFINGKYIEPPYVVERWGTGIRINGKQVTGQVVDWNEFLKTQKGVKTVRQEPAVSVPAVSAPPAVIEDVDESSLDDLFDDDPKPKKKAAVRKSSAPVAAKPKPTVSYELEGEFVPTDSTKAMVARINAFRTEIDRTLRSGGFICFGDSYSQVTGDARTLQGLLEKLPECQKNAQDVQDFCEKARAANLVYLHEVLRQDLYRNRTDYRKLQDLRTKLKKNNEMQKVLEEVSTPLF